MSAQESRLWFGSGQRPRPARVTLFCLPFSGGGASIYSAWQRLVPPEIEVVPIRLPGREARIHESLDISAESIAQILVSRIDLPFGIYGHSMGARLGFDVLRALRVLGAPDPVRFYPAASESPDTPDTFAKCVELADADFIDVLINQLGAPTELRDVPELRQLVLPVLRNDLRWCRDYRYRPEAPLSTDIVVFAGEADRIVTPAGIAGWARHGRQCVVVTIPGDHFFIRTHAQRLISILAEDLLSAVRPASVLRPHTAPEA